MAGLYIGMEEDGRSTIAIILSLSLSLFLYIILKVNTGLGNDGLMFCLVKR